MRSGGLHRLGVLVRHNLLLLRRDPGALISRLVTPMLLMLALRPVFSSPGTGGPTQVVIGMLVMFSVLFLSVVGTALLIERVWQTWDHLRATPARAPELLLGKTIPVFVLLVAQQALLLAFGAAVVGMPVRGAPALIAVAVVIWSVTLLAIGSALAMVVRSFGALSAVCDVGALTLTTLGGALAPIARMPGWCQAIAPASPGYWAMTVLRGAVGADLPAVLRGTAVLAGVTLAAGGFACFRFTRGLSTLDG